MRRISPWYHPNSVRKHGTLYALRGAPPTDYSSGAEYRRESSPVVLRSERLRENAAHFQPAVRLSVSVFYRFALFITAFYACIITP